MAIQHVPDALFCSDQEGFRLEGIYWIQVGDRKIGRLLGEQVNDLFEGVADDVLGPLEAKKPPAFLTYDEYGASWWFFDLKFFCDHDGLPPEQAQALVLAAAREVEAAEEAERHAETQADLARIGAQLGMTAEDVGRLSTSEARRLGVYLDDDDRLAVETGRRAHSRTTISDDVKIFVWRRDEGRCVRCGSNADLEFDHIIPLTMGGSNTARNLQLLCEACNRSKGGNLV